MVADARAMDSWNHFNASASIGAFGSAGTAATSFNMSYNPGGMGGTTNVFNTIGAGIPTGTPNLYGGPSQPSQPGSLSTYLDLAGRTIGGAGVGAEATALKYFNDTSWLANNGERYSLNARGNQYYGGYKEARAMSSAAHDLGSKTFYAGSVISIGQLYNAYQENDTFGVAKSGLDLSVGGAAWAIGSKTGFGLGAAYYGLDFLLHSEDLQ